MVIRDKIARESIRTRRQHFEASNVGVTPGKNLRFLDEKWRQGNQRTVGGPGANRTKHRDAGSQRQEEKGAQGTHGVNLARLDARRQPGMGLPGRMAAPPVIQNHG